jgi:hypothetical protein
VLLEAAMPVAGSVELNVACAFGALDAMLRVWSKKESASKKVFIE